jgi:spermidine synthase
VTSVNVRAPIAGALVAPGRGAIGLALMGASGFAALGYQIVWTHQSALWLGHEIAAVLAVVAAFFGGLGAGALALGPRIARSAQPARWFAACEAVTGLWSLALAALMAPVAQALLVLTGAQPTPAWQWSVAFIGTFLLLLPATAAMGATLPAMERVLAPLRTSGTPLAALYAANTLGAVAGVLAVAFWLVPALGLTRAAGVCAALNLLCAVEVSG